MTRLIDVVIENTDSDKMLDTVKYLKATSKDLKNRGADDESKEHANDAESYLKIALSLKNNKKNQAAKELKKSGDFVDIREKNPEIAKDLEGRVFK